LELNGHPISFTLGFFSGVSFIGLASLISYRQTAHFFVPGVTSPIVYQLDESGVTASYGGTHTSIPWANVDGWLEREASVLMLAAGTMFIMPYDAMSGGFAQETTLDQVNRWRKAAP
jgi:hypothetical protein